MVNSEAQSSEGSVRTQKFNRPLWISESIFSECTCGKSCLLRTKILKIAAAY